MSLALFTDQEQVNGTFSSGSIALNPAGIAGPGCIARFTAANVEGILSQVAVAHGTITG